MTTTDRVAEDDLCSDCLGLLDEHCTYCGDCSCEYEECRDEDLG